LGCGFFDFYGFEFYCWFVVEGYWVDFVDVCVGDCCCVDCYLWGYVVAVLFVCVCFELVVGGLIVGLY